MQLKGVKRIVSGLKRRISHISLRRHRRGSSAESDDDAVPSLSAALLPAALLASIPAPTPVTFPASTRADPSLDTLTRSVSDGCLAKRPDDCVEDSDSDEDSASTSTSTSYHDAQSKKPAHSASCSGLSSHPTQSFSEDEDWRSTRTGLSARFPPPESLTAPLESLVLDEPPRVDAAWASSYTLQSVEEPLAAPLENPVFPSPPLHLEPWEIPLPPDHDADFVPSSPPSPTLSPSPMDPLGVSPALNEPPAARVVAESPPHPDELLTSTLDSELSASMQVAREAPFVSPSTSVGVPQVLDPFLEDEDIDPPSVARSEDGESDEHDRRAAQAALSPPAEEIALAPSEPSSPEPPASSVNVNKAVPPTPAAAPSDDEDEEDTPELYLPGLTLPTMFLPIPNTDPLSTLLNKYISPELRPPRSLTGDYARSGGEIHPLVMTNSWRAMARLARDRIVAADPEEVSTILSLWYLRLSALARMRLFNQTAAECTNLFAVLHAVEPPPVRAFLLERVLPFELDVLHAKLRYWAADHMGYLDALAALLARCKRKAREAARKRDGAAQAMWTERGARVALIVASQLVEMKDFAAAARTLEPLCEQRDASGAPLASPALRSALARVHLQSGNAAAAAPHLAALAADPTLDPAQRASNAALAAAAAGDWPRAEAELRALLAVADALSGDGDGAKDALKATNNLAVVLLNQGRLGEAIDVLEDALRASPAAVAAAEPVLFNLSTLYELRSSAGADKKRQLLVEVSKWAGDGLRTTCLKMPTN
ncbi:uncharacterized protein BXZ73DRAFT_88548 [Epithele typhae]|uniref:uncharacterized protein n=1 Tax=Epithele typhae TaxID=378194 RepID=UPI00200812C0|nr:uncharacterized protein BXZ73DRAFT_88548 [Epithele typhae]KAH9940845.1 hypothetical protein BXZ73DRAFT_88548 [Epithele typhae]